MADTSAPPPSAAAALYPNLPSAMAPVAKPAAGAEPATVAAALFSGKKIAIPEDGIAKPAAEIGDHLSPENKPKTPQTTPKTPDSPVNEAKSEPFDANRITLADPAEQKLLEEFSQIAGQAKLTHSAAEQMLSLHTKANADAWTALRGQWASQSKADAEIGGAALGPAVQRIQAALRDYGDADFATALDHYGFGDHPAVIRVLNRLARAAGY